MEIGAIQSKNKPQQVSYIKAGLIGAGAGYSLKYILPITKQERDDQSKIFKISADDFKSQSKLAQAEHSEFLQDCANAITKRIRPTWAFIGAGALIALVGALIYNINKRNS